VQRRFKQVGAVLERLIGWAVAEDTRSREYTFIMPTRAAAPPLFEISARQHCVDVVIPVGAIAVRVIGCNTGYAMRRREIVVGILIRLIDVDWESRITRQLLDERIDVRRTRTSRIAGSLALGGCSRAGSRRPEVAANVGLYDQSQLHRHFKRILV
jgi:hypothetical protein